MYMMQMIFEIYFQILFMRRDCGALMVTWVLKSSSLTFIVGVIYSPNYRNNVKNETVEIARNDYPPYFYMVIKVTD